MCLFLSIEQVLALQRYALDEDGGEPGILNQAALESSVFAPRQTVGGEDAYPTLFDKAAAYSFFLCKNHAFNDGNKRISLMTAQTFLRQNGWKMQWPDPGPANAILGIATDSLSLKELAALYEQHSVPWD